MGILSKNFILVQIRSGKVTIDKISKPLIISSLEKTYPEHRPVAVVLQYFDEKEKRQLLTVSNLNLQVTFLIPFTEELFLKLQDCVKTLEEAKQKSIDIFKDLPHVNKEYSDKKHSKC